VADLLQQHDCPIGAHVAFLGHAAGDTIHFIAHGTRDERQIAGVQGHVAALDAFGRECTQGTNVLGKTHCDGDLGQFTRGSHAEDLERDPGQR
jgi:hypothetical protein